MNERIRELAEQARVQDRGYFIYQYGGPTGHQSVEKAIDLEKFAELIVQECIDTYDHWATHSMDKTAFVVARTHVKEHFGIEQ